MSGTLRIGVAGAGLIGRKHIELVAASSDCVLAGIADPSPEAKAFAESHGIPWYADHRALLERETPDGMIVASPNALHLPMALDCVARGVPALVEKPVTDTVASAQRLCEAVRRSGVPVLVGHHRRHNPRIKAIREKVAGGGIGQLTAVVGLWLLKKPDDYFDVAWRREAGGGPLLINLVHDIDNLRFICGEISEVQAMTSNKSARLCRRGYRRPAVEIRGWRDRHGNAVGYDAGTVELGTVIGRERRLSEAGPALLSVRRHQGIAVGAHHGAVVVSGRRRLVCAAFPKPRSMCPRQIRWWSSSGTSAPSSQEAKFR